MKTLREKLAQLGESMAKARIEQRLGCRVVKKQAGDGSDRYQVEFINPDGSARAVQPTAEWAYKLQSVLFELADELAMAVADMSAAYETERARADVATERAERAFPKGYEDGLVDGGIQTRTDLIEKLQRHRAAVAERLQKEITRAFQNRGVVNALSEELRLLDQLAVDFASAPSAPNREEAEAISATPQR